MLCSLFVLACSSSGDSLPAPGPPPGSSPDAAGVPPQLEDDVTVWPNVHAPANSDPWLAEHHAQIRELRPRFLVINFANGIGEGGKIILLFLAALWIMAIAARSGVSGVKISKVHAAYSLGANRAQIMRHVIIPNSLPEIFTGARVAMGVCWGTVVAAELVAAEQGAGMMIMVASRFQNTDIVILGIILIGVIGFGIDMLMRYAERLLVPWKGKG